MIVEYHRPETLDTALQLLNRRKPLTVPLIGNIRLGNEFPEPIAVVDLQMLALNKIEQEGNQLELGAMVYLQDMLNDDRIQSNLRKAIIHEASYNLRHSSTVSGSLMMADGRSPFSTAILALGAEVVTLPGDRTTPIGELFPFRFDQLKGRIIVKVNIPVNVNLAYTYVARTPADLPIVCVAVAKWSSGRTRVALGGFGLFPQLWMDGPNPIGAEIAARNAYLEAGDQWASSEYRSSMAGILTRRCLEIL